MSSPCPSSHASTILAAALQKPAPSPPRAPGPAKSISGSPSDSIDKSSSPRSQPVYHYYGLASSSTGDSLDEDDEPMEPLLLVSAAGNTSTDISMTTFDVFGPVHYPGTHLRTYEQRQVQADVAAAARVRILRTAAWIRKLRRDFARGSSAIAGDGDAIAK
ncbi:hypothetical protein FB451DRAFT_1219795 [Mycena latifolia]|nr:hypothetical protein FB451DRAFT_1302257 [Mycena latifolia]KAJ7444945.1 hypothetical protein FB451DRAFT_1293962 [Mycena latifolia]KAJ7470733.1 hypothetical protein FB451DRAFT_1254673 [Mycena latifolia]KAJ7492436.1 hypothetical protein FB451DRAFT_1218296 [Mycena latifolia]KAJ7492849.1 hypothetical protein FB451DRAFT_1219795 [Mycena latifolia]